MKKKPIKPFSLETYDEFIEKKKIYNYYYRFAPLKARNDKKKKKKIIKWGCKRTKKEKKENRKGITGGRKRKKRGIS